MGKCIAQPTRTQANLRYSYPNILHYLYDLHHDFLFCTFSTAALHMIGSLTPRSQILYQGLKASAVSLITMVLGFL